MLLVEMPEVSPELLAKRIQARKDVEEMQKKAEEKMYKAIEAYKKEEELLYESGKIVNGRLVGSVNQEKEYTNAQVYYTSKIK